MLLDLFNECVNDTGYISTPYRGNYKMRRDSRVLTIYFQKSCGFWDWLSNFDFAAVPYRNMADSGTITEGTYRKIRTILNKKYGLSSDSIFAESA